MQLTTFSPGFLNHPKNGLMLVLRCPRCGMHGVGAPVVIQAMGQPRPEGKWAVTCRDFTLLTMEPSIQSAWPKETPPELRCPFHFSIVGGQIVMH